MSKVLIDPLSRIEGHLSIELDVVGGKVKDAKCRGNMYRGFEKILQGRNPVDANQITQRICGVCPISHGIASSRALDAAFGIKANTNGRLLRNIALGSNYLQSHILHFYALSALDYVDITAILHYKGNDAKMNAVKTWVEKDRAAKKGISEETIAAPFLPRYEGADFYIKDRELNLSAISHYLQALEYRQKCHQLVATFAGRVPHAIGLVPGGVTQIPTQELVDSFLKTLTEVEQFINTVYLPDVVAVAKAYSSYFSLGRFDQFLAYGVFGESDSADEAFYLPAGVLNGNTIKDFESAKITEQVGRSRYTSATNLHPSQGATEPAPEKAEAYTWIKSPRYNNAPYEVGPLARVLIGYHQGHAEIKKGTDALLAAFGAQPTILHSALGRHATRALEAKLVANRLKKWVSELELGKSPRTTYEIPMNGEGMGLVEAARGALGHWVSIKDYKIANYQCVVPTTWNASPLDDNGIAGPIEQSLIGTPIVDEKNPIEAARIVRSFDPCLACAIHVIDGAQT